MSKVPVFVGLDYHQSSVQVCVLDKDGVVLLNRKCRNSWRNIVSLVGTGRRVHAAIETCTGAADLADELAEQPGWSVDLAHPGYVARIKQSPDKTDFGDARLLADLRRVSYLPRVWHAPEFVRNLRRLIRYRQQLVANRRSLKLRIRALLRDHRLTIDESPWTKKWLAWVRETDGLQGHSRWIMNQHLVELSRLNSQLKETERYIQQATEQDQMVQRLLEVRGVGLITAVTIRAEIGRFDRFRTGKQLARFCGLTPRNASSGKRQSDAGVIKAGNPELRRVVVQAAHRLLRYDDHWCKMAQRLLQHGKHISVVIAAVANRWMRRLYHEMKGYELAA